MRKKNFSLEVELPEELKSKEINGIKVIEGLHKGFLEPAVRKFIDKYYKLPTLFKIIEMEIYIKEVIILNLQDKKHLNKIWKEYLILKRTLLNVILPWLMFFIILSMKKMKMEII